MVGVVFYSGDCLFLLGHYWDMEARQRTSFGRLGNLKQ